jgi:hypothetical protein
MQAFHNDPAIKAKYQARLAAHRTAEELIQGTGFSNGRGCAVGCTLDAYDHSRYPIELGLPQWLAHLEDALFEALPVEQAKQFAEDFLEAVPVGADVEPVNTLLGIEQLQRLGRHADRDANCRVAVDLALDWLKDSGSGAWAFDLRNKLCGLYEAATKKSSQKIILAALTVLAETGNPYINVDLATRTSSAEQAVAADDAAHTSEDQKWLAADVARTAYWRWTADTLLALLRACK